MTGQLTMELLLELHPWPAEYARDKKIERLWVYDLPGTPPQCGRWSSDTSRMNRALGTAEMTLTEQDGKRYGSSKAGAVRHEWLEVPWSWVAEQWLTSTRIYERGFMRANYSIQRLEPTATGTRLYVFLRRRYREAHPARRQCASAFRRARDPARRGAASGAAAPSRNCRDLFSEEDIGADVKLAVGEQTLLFTDVVGVDCVLRVARRPGSIRRDQEALPGVSSRPHRHADPPPHLAQHRTVHRGAAQRERRLLRRHGQRRAKLQALAEGYQIAMSAATYRSAGVAAFLADQAAPLEDLDYESKALENVVRVKRSTLYREP